MHLCSGVDNAPSTYWGTAGYAVISAVLSVLLAFAVIFTGRLLLAPVRLYWAEHERANSLADSKSKTKEQLEKFYIECGYLIKAAIPKGDDAEFKKYHDNTNAWLNDAAQWIDANIGEFAREKFLDRTGMMAASVPRAFNATHGQIILNLTRHRQNLRAMIDALPN